MKLKDRILELRKDGKTYNEIKNEIGCAKSTISYYCNNIKIIRVDNLNVDIQEKILKLRKDNKTFKEIYKILKIDNIGITRENVRKVCSKNGLSYLDRLDIDEIDEIKNEYDKLKSVKKVTEKLGYSRNTVRKHIDLKSEVTTDDERKKNKSNFVIEWRKRKKSELVEYKGGKCEKCGYDKCIDVLQFHHLDPKEKDFTISRKSYSFERLKKEVDKCILVCANCHLEIHYELKNINNAT